MDDNITGIVISPADFCIRSKADASEFLRMVGEGSIITVKDLSRPGMHFIIARYKGTEFASVAYERDYKGVFEPDIMRNGKAAVDIVFKGRKSINHRFFSVKRKET